MDNVLADFRTLLREKCRLSASERNVCLALAAVNLWHNGGGESLGLSKYYRYPIKCFICVRPYSPTIKATRPLLGVCRSNPSGTVPCITKHFIRTSRYILDADTPPTLDVLPRREQITGNTLECEKWVECLTMYFEIFLPIGIRETQFVGRFQTVKLSERATIFLDCAHTPESIEVGTQNAPTG